VANPRSDHAFRVSLLCGSFGELVDGGAKPFFDLALFVMVALNIPCPFTHAFTFLLALAVSQQTAEPTSII